MKTLKDLQKEYEWRYDTYIALRQEAIKWIKEMPKSVNYTYQKHKWNSFNGELLPKNQQSKIIQISKHSAGDIGAIEWIKHFFNITEEELNYVKKTDKEA